MADCGSIRCRRLFQAFLPGSVVGSCQAHDPCRDGKGRAATCRDLATAHAERAVFLSFQKCFSNRCRALRMVWSHCAGRGLLPVTWTRSDPDRKTADRTWKDGCSRWRSRLWP